MRVLITGAGGFIGAHLHDELLRHGYDVIPIDKGNCDLRRRGELEEKIALHKPATVIHLAAKVGRLFGEADPMVTVEDNAGITASVAKLCGDYKIRLVYASTSEVYGDQGERLCTEKTEPRLPHNLYGLSKYWGEQACRLYAPENLLIWRISMPYGPGLPPGYGRAAIINFLHQAHKRKPIPVHVGSERSWCWIGDTVRAMRMTLDVQQGGVFNVGRDDAAVPMTEVAKLACDLVGAPHSLIEEIPAPARQTVVKRLATDKIRYLGWRPEVELEEGMAITLDWLLREHG